MMTPMPNGQEPTVSTVRRETTAETLHGSGSAARRAVETVQTRTMKSLMSMIPWAVVLAFLAIVNAANAMCIEGAIASCSIGGQAGIKECIGGRWGPCEISPAPEPPIATLVDLNGLWAAGGTPGPLISAAFTSITINMAAYNRPSAHGSIVDDSTITVTFPDDATYTGTLQPPNMIIWSNGSAWTKF